MEKLLDRILAESHKKFVEKEPEEEQLIENEEVIEEDNDVMTIPVLSSIGAGFGALQFKKLVDKSN